jgi:hypothetical protein
VILDEEKNMILSDLKLNMLLPKKEIFINKIVRIRGKKVHLISITSEEHRNILWGIYQFVDNSYMGIDAEERVEYMSNRDEKIGGIQREINTQYTHISEITIQKQKMTFSVSSAGGIYYMDYKKCMQLQHFIENGMTTTNWNEVDLENLVIAAYEQQEGEEFPEIDLSKELDITLKVDREFKQVLINQPIRIGFGEMEKGKQFYFYDSIEKKDRIFYINKMEHYDLWEETARFFEGEQMQSLTEVQVKQMKENHFACLERICPKGMDLAILEYEAEDDEQLDFYSKEYLDEKPVYNSSSCGMLFKPDKEFGANGFKSRVCLIQPIEKGFYGSIDIELFSRYIEIPEEIIMV